MINFYVFNLNFLYGRALEYTVLTMQPSKLAFLILVRSTYSTYNLNLWCYEVTKLYLYVPVHTVDLPFCLFCSVGWVGLGWVGGISRGLYVVGFFNLISITFSSTIQQYLKGETGWKIIWTKSAVILRKIENKKLFNSRIFVTFLPRTIPCVDHPFCGPSQLRKIPSADHPNCGPYPLQTLPYSDHLLCRPSLIRTIPTANHPLCGPLSLWIIPSTVNPFCGPYLLRTIASADHSFCRPSLLRTIISVEHPLCGPSPLQIIPFADHPFCGPSLLCTIPSADHPFCVPSLLQTIPSADHPYCGPSPLRTIISVEHPHCGPSPLWTIPSDLVIIENI